MSSGSAASNAPGRTLSPELQKALGRVTEISSLPEVTTKIVQVVEDPRATARDMHDIVRNDPALAAKILKVVNSAFYGLPSQIASLDRAILMLGLSAVKNIALAASLSRMFKPEAVSEQFAARDLWRHCIAVGVAAREVGRLARLDEADEAFVGGLVHDMGLIVVQQMFPEKLREVADTCYAQPQEFCDVEDRLVGADHQLFGFELAARWKFPPGLRYVIGFHHEPMAAPLEYRKMVMAVYVADTICCRGQYGFWLPGSTQEVTGDMREELRITEQQIADLNEMLPDRVDEAERVFVDDSH